MTPELWTPRRRGAPRVECAPPFGFGLPFDMPPVILGNSAAFAPTSVAAIKLWLRADLGVTIATGVSQWNDQSGTGDANKNVAQATGSKQPTRNTSDAAYNNQTTLSFATASSQELVSGTWAASLAEPETIFFVGHQIASASPYVFTDDALTTNLRLMDNNGGGQVLRAYAGASLNSAVSCAAPFVSAVEFNGATSKIYMSAITATVSGSTGVAPANRAGLRLGVQGGGGGQYLNGKIAEVIIYGSVLSLSDRTAVTNYLGTRYGITIGA